MRVGVVRVERAAQLEVGLVGRRLRSCVCGEVAASRRRRVTPHACRTNAKSSDRTLGKAVTPARGISSWRRAGPGRAGAAARSAAAVAFPAPRRASSVCNAQGVPPLNKNARRRGARRVAATAHAAETIHVQNQKGAAAREQPQTLVAARRPSARRPAPATCDARPARERGRVGERPVDEQRVSDATYTHRRPGASSAASSAAHWSAPIKHAPPL